MLSLFDVGCISRAGQAAYSSSKFAVEAFSDALRQEMLKWGVFVIIIQPAYFPGKFLPLVKGWGPSDFRFSDFS